MTSIMPHPDSCARCGKAIEDPASAIQVLGGRDIGGRVVPTTDLVCLPCFYNPHPRPEAPKPARTLPYKTVAEANARAAKVSEQLGIGLPNIWGDADRGYRVIGDSPMVPGYKPVN